MEAFGIVSICTNLQSKCFGAGGKDTAMAVLLIFGHGFNLIIYNAMNWEHFIWCCCLDDYIHYSVLSNYGGTHAPMNEYKLTTVSFAN